MAPPTDRRDMPAFWKDGEMAAATAKGELRGTPVVASLSRSRLVWGGAYPRGTAHDHGPDRHRRVDDRRWTPDRQSQRLSAGAHQPERLWYEGRAGRVALSPLASRRAVGTEPNSVAARAEEAITSEHTLWLASRTGRNIR